MARFDAEERKARGEAVPPDIELYLKSLVASAIEADGVTDIYAAAGIDRPDLSHLDDAFIARMREQRNPHLAIEALRRLVEQEMRKVTKHNIVKQTSFSERLADLMRKYTNQNLTSAEIIAELVALAKEVSADAEPRQHLRPAAEQRRTRLLRRGRPERVRRHRDGRRRPRRHRPRPGPHPPPRRHDRLASRDDVRAKIRSTIKRLLAKYGYPPDAQQDATDLVLRQMETFADEWSPAADR